MAFSALSTLVHRSPGTIVYGNQLRDNFDYLITNCAAMWVDFDGSAGTLSARASVNVASLTDSGAGTYTVSFTTGMANTGYICFVNGVKTGVAADDGNYGDGGAREYQTGLVRVKSFDHLGSVLDFFHVNVLVIGLKN